MKKKEKVNLGALITASIETAKIKQGDVIGESGIARSTFYRGIGAGGKISKPNVVALVRAINKLAKKVVIEENQALGEAGFDAGLQNPMTIQIDAGVQLIVEKSKFSKKRLSSLTADLKSAYEKSLRSSTAEREAPPKKVERKIKVVKKAAEKRRA